MSRYLPLLFAGLLVSSVLARAPGNLPKVRQCPALPLADQDNRAFNPTAHRGHVLVLIYGDRASIEANKKLGEWLHVTFHPTAKGLPPILARQQEVRPLEGAPPGKPGPDVRTLAVACCGKLPEFVQGLVRGQIKVGAGDLPILIDFQDAMKTTFGLVPEVSNLIIVDRSGLVRYTANGPFAPEQMTQLATILENLRREPVQPPLNGR